MCRAKNNEKNSQEVSKNGRKHEASSKHSKCE